MKLFQMALFLSLFASMSSVESAHAEWICEAGQPEQCLNEVNGYVNIGRANIAYFQNELSDSAGKKQRCWDSQRRATDNASASSLALATKRGALGELNSSLRFLQRLYQMQQTQVSVVTQFQAQFNSYFREIVLALKNDISSGAFSELSTLQDSFTAELQGAPNGPNAQVLRMVINMIDEVKSAVRSRGSASAGLLQNLTAVMQPLYGGNGRELSSLARGAVEVSLSHEDLLTMNLPQKVSEILISSQSILSTIDQQRTQVDQEVLAAKRAVNALVSDVQDYQDRANSLNQSCQSLQQRLDVELPPKLQSEQDTLNTNLDWLAHDRCHTSHCHRDNDGPHHERP